MTENNHTQNTEPPTPPSPAAPDQPTTRWRDRRVGVITLVVSTIAALVIGGMFGTAAGGLVGYGVGHHDHPDHRVPMLYQGQQGGPQLPPGMAPDRPDDSNS